METKLYILQEKEIQTNTASREPPCNATENCITTTLTELETRNKRLCLPPTLSPLLPAPQLPAEDAPLVLRLPARQHTVHPAVTDQPAVHTVPLLPRPSAPELLPVKAIAGAGAGQKEGRHHHCEAEALPLPARTELDGDLVGAGLVVELVARQPLLAVHEVPPLLPGAADLLAVGADPDPAAPGGLVLRLHLEPGGAAGAGGLGQGEGGDVERHTLAGRGEDGEGAGGGGEGVPGGVGQDDGTRGEAEVAKGEVPAQAPVGRAQGAQPNLPGGGNMTVNIWSWLIVLPVGSLASGQPQTGEDEEGSGSHGGHGGHGGRRKAPIQWTSLAEVEGRRAGKGEILVGDFLSQEQSKTHCGVSASSHRGGWCWGVEGKICQCLEELMLCFVFNG